MRKTGLSADNAAKNYELNIMSESNQPAQSNKPADQQTKPAQGQNVPAGKPQKPNFKKNRPAAH